MEQPPQPRNIEGKEEKILSSQEVLNALSIYAEGCTPTRELSDEKGVYLLEVEIAGEREGEKTEYQYKRKGIHSNQNTSSEGSVISAIYYQDGIPVGGEKVAILDEQTGEWKAWEKL